MRLGQGKGGWTRIQGDHLCSLFAFPTPQVSPAAREPLLGDAGCSFKCSSKPKGSFPTHGRAQQSLLCCCKGRLIPAHTWLTAMLLPQAELSCPCTAPCPLQAPARPCPPAISMGFRVLSSGIRLFCYNVLTDHFQLSPGHLLTSDPCAKDPLSIKPNKPCQVLVHVRSYCREWTICGETEARDSEQIGSVC